MLLLAVALATQRATDGTNAARSLHGCEDFECLAEKLANANMNGLLRESLRAAIEWGAACTVLVAATSLA
eukprot:5316458-Pleurochrysis_carterae.AAC.1